MNICHSSLSPGYLFSAIIVFITIATSYGDQTPDTSAQTDFQLHPVTVFSTRKERVFSNLRSESQALDLSVSKISQDRIQQQGSQTLIEALNYLPGTWTETRGRKVKQFLSFRGQKYPYPNYALDGAWQRSFHEMPYFFSTFDVEGIEVIRSSAALLHGLSGLSGVINVVPRKYTKPGYGARFEYGAFDTYRLGLSHGSRVNDLSYSAGAHIGSTNGPEGKHAAERNLTTHGRIGWQNGENLKIQSNVCLLRGSRELANAEDPAKKSLQSTVEKYDPYLAGIWTLRGNYHWSEHAATEALAHYTGRNFHFSNPKPTGHITHLDRDHEWGMQLLQAHAIGASNLLRYGGSYFRWLAPDGKRFFEAKRLDLHTYSVVLVDEQMLGPVNLDAGIRMNRTYQAEYGAFNIDGSSKSFESVESIQDRWEPWMPNTSLGATYFAMPWMSIHLHGAAGMVSPRVGALDTLLQEPLNEKRSKLDVGLRMRKELFGNLNVVGFVVNQTDGLGLTGMTHLTADSLEFELYENRNRRQWGVELEYKTPRLFNLASGFMNVVQTQALARSGNEMIEDREKPEIIVGGGLSIGRAPVFVHVFGKHVSAYESKRFSSDNAFHPVGDYSTVDATIEWSVLNSEKLKLFGSAINITDRGYSTVVGYPDDGRRIFFGIQFKQ